jgi:hypothetical protein
MILQNSDSEKTYIRIEKFLKLLKLDIYSRFSCIYATRFECTFAQQYYWIYDKFAIWSSQLFTNIRGVKSPSPKPLSRVLARILDLGCVSNDQGVHMSITLNSQITVLFMLANNNACGCSMLCNQIQGEHTLISRTDIKILSYFSNSWGYLKPF